MVVIPEMETGNYKLKIWCESDLLPASKEHVYSIGFCTIPYIWVYIRSWHTWPAQKEATSCTRFYVQDWRWIGKIFNSDPCELILLHWFLWWYLYLFKISCQAEVVTSPRKSVTATSVLTSAECQCHRSSIWPWSGMPKVRLYDTFLGGLRQKLPPHLWPPQPTIQSSSSSTTARVWIYWHVWPGHVCLLPYVHPRGGHRYQLPFTICSLGLDYHLGWPWFCQTKISPRQLRLCRSTSPSYNRTWRQCWPSLLLFSLSKEATYTANSNLRSLQSPTSRILHQS